MHVTFLLVRVLREERVDIELRRELGRDLAFETVQPRRVCIERYTLSRRNKCIRPPRPPTEIRTTFTSFPFHDRLPFFFFRGL